MSMENNTPTSEEAGTWYDEETWICKCPPSVGQYNNMTILHCEYCDMQRPERPEAERLQHRLQVASDFLDQPSTKVETTNLVEMLLRKAEDIEEFLEQVKKITSHTDYYITGPIEQAAKQLRSAVGHAMKIKKS